MNLKEYKELVRIRLLLDENPTKGKQLLTGWIKGWELLHLKEDCPHGTLGGGRHCFKCHPELLDKGGD